MGMTIDKAILRIEHSWMSDDDKETADFIINTMRKYQKIEQIYKRFQKDGGYYHHMAWLDVMEVVEDGIVD